jgi:hypothetical protein
MEAFGLLVSLGLSAFAFISNYNRDRQIESAVNPKYNFVLD